MMSNVLVVCDSGQIEARKVAWLAGDQDVLDTFRRNDAKTAEFKLALKECLAAGDAFANEKAAVKALAEAGIEEGDYYSDAGSAVLGRRITKETDPEDRQVSKGMELGLGFGMGWEKFGCEQAKGMMGAKPKVFGLADAERLGVDVGAFERDAYCMKRARAAVTRVPQEQRAVHFAVAKHLVELWRSRKVAIVDLWGTMGQAIEWMDEMGPEDAPRPIGPGGVLQVVRHGLLSPCGIRLRYDGLRGDPDARGRMQYTYLAGHGGERKKIYGGLLTENVVQHLAREVVFMQGLYVRRRWGYQQAMSTHDELVYVVPEAEGPEAFARVQETMMRPLAWCPDLPLNASGGWGKCYGAVK